MTQLSPPDTTPRTSGGPRPCPDRTPAAPATDFESFCTTHLPRLVALVRPHSDSHDTAMDAVQDALLDAWRRWETIDNPLAYVSTAARHNAWARHRRHARTTPLTTALYEENLILRDSSETVVHHVTLLSALRDLPNMQRSAIVLHYFEGLSTPEVADLLGVTESTVRTHLVNARRRLKGLLTASPDQHPSAGSSPQQPATPRPAATPHSRPPVQVGLAADTDKTAPNMVETLVARTQAGHPEAFGSLYDKYADHVYRYVYLRIGEREPAENLTSKTFLRALRRIHLFTWQSRDFNAWLLTIARSLIADYVQSNNFQLALTARDMPSSGTPGARSQDLPGNADLLETVRLLNPQQQECITLRFLQGLSVAETARIMGKNQGAIKTLQHRALRTMSRLLTASAHRTRPASADATGTDQGPLVSRALHEVAAECTRAARPTATVRKRIRATLQHQPDLSMATS